MCFLEDALCFRAGSFALELTLFDFGVLVHLAAGLTLWPGPFIP